MKKQFKDIAKSISHSKFTKKYFLIGAFLLLPNLAFARGYSGFGSIIILALMIGAAFVLTMIIFGGPPTLINKLSGRNPSDEIGGKVFALSFAVAPFVAVPLMYLFGKENAADGMILGYLITIYALNAYLSKTDDKGK